MPDEADAILAQIDGAFARYDEVTRDAQGIGWENVNDADILEVETILVATIERLSPRGSRYREAAQETIGHNGFNHPQICRDVRGCSRPCERTTPPDTSARLRS